MVLDVPCLCLYGKTCRGQGHIVSPRAQLVSKEVGKVLSTVSDLLVCSPKALDSVRHKLVDISCIVDNLLFPVSLARIILSCASHADFLAVLRVRLYCFPRAPARLQQSWHSASNHGVSFTDLRQTLDFRAVLVK